MADDVSQYVQLTGCCIPSRMPNNCATSVLNNERNIFISLYLEFRTFKTTQLWLSTKHYTIWRNGGCGWIGWIHANYNVVLHTRFRKVEIILQTNSRRAAIFDENCCAVLNHELRFLNCQEKLGDNISNVTVNDVPRCSVRTLARQGPHLLTWINFNPNMNKSSHVPESVGWNYLSIPKLQRLCCWSLEMNK